MADLLALSARAIDDNDTTVELNRVTGELSEVGDGVAMVESFSHVVVFRTEAGLVLFDTAMPMLARGCIESLRRWSSARVHDVVFTHGHFDHVGGARALFEEAETNGVPVPRLTGHENVAKRFDRYALTNGYNLAINKRQFGFSPPPGMQFLDPRTPRPDTTFSQSMGMNAGGLQLELRHARGETDDHLWAWVPAHKAICTGDFLLPNTPNAGNPQKQQRYPLEWARALREMDATGAELLLPAHGAPIGGRARIHVVLDRVASALEHLVGETLRLMNEGAALDVILHSVKLTDADLAWPYLKPTYDEPEFIVRNVWRLYGGWYDGNPAHLKPAPEAALAAEYVALAGGVKNVLARADELAASGEMRLACHLVETARQAAPEDQEVHALRARVYERRRDAELSLMAKGIFRSAAADSRSAMEAPDG